MDKWTEIGNVITDALQIENVIMKTFANIYICYRC